MKKLRKEPELSVLLFIIRYLCHGKEVRKQGNCAEVQNGNDGCCCGLLACLTDVKVFHKMDFNSERDMDLLVFSNSTENIIYKTVIFLFTEG